AWGGLRRRRQILAGHELVVEGLRGQIQPVEERGLAKAHLERHDVNAEGGDPFGRKVGGAVGDNGDSGGHALAIVGGWVGRPAYNSPMSALGRFEGFMQDLIDRRVVRMLGGGLQPAELAQALARSMERGQRPGSAAPVAPNRYVAALNPEDYAELCQLEVDIDRELAGYAVELARERGLNFDAAPRVTLTADTDVARGAVRIVASHSRPPAEARSPRPPAGARRAHGAGRGPREGGRERTAGPSAEVCLEVPGADGQPIRLPVQQYPFAIGRAEGNDLMLPDVRVSRRHAIIEESGDRVLLRDLRSRNGSTVNGRPVAEAELCDGDRLAFGGFEVVVRKSPER